MTQAVDEALDTLPFSLDALSVRLALELDDLVGSEVGVGQQQCPARERLGIAHPIPRATGLTPSRLSSLVPSPSRP